MANENLNWTIDLDLAGVPLLGFFVPFPTGPYKAKIVKTAEIDNEGKKNVRVDVISQEDGPTKGLPLSVTLGKDMTKQGNKYAWKRLMASVGASSETLERNGLKVGPDTLKDRTCYVHVTEKAEGEEYDQRQFITKEIYEQLKANPQLAAAAAAAAHKSNGAPAASTAPGAPGGSVPAQTGGGTVTAPPPDTLLGQLKL